MDFANKLNIILEADGEVTLNHQLWEQDNNLRPTIRQALLRLAYDFAAKHNIGDRAITDIILTGSLASYRWTPYSDVDLHIVINYQQIPAKQKLASDYFKTAKNLWNKQHDVKICNHEVEIYVQDQNEPHHAIGIYSLLRDGWLKQPARSAIAQMPATTNIERKASRVQSRIDTIAGLIDHQQYKDAYIYADKLQDYLKQMRTIGLRDIGENSLENQAFKHLRNHGELDRLVELRTRAYDMSLSINNCDNQSED